MRILVISQYFHPEPFRINDLVSALLERGHAVTVLTGVPNYPEGQRYAGYGWSGMTREQFRGVRVVRVPLVTRGRLKNWRLALNYLSFAFAACLLGPLLCRGKFDLIFVFQPSPVTVGLPALLLRRVKRAPVVFWIQDLWPETLAAVGRSTFFAGLLADFIHRRCDLLLVQSRAFAPPLIARGSRAECIRYLPNWAEAFYQAGSTTGTDPLQGFTGVRLVFAGNLGSAQSIETILAAAALVHDRRDIRWILIGDGLMRTSIENEIRQRKLEPIVALIERHPPESMPHFFAAADALLVTLRADPVFAMTIPSKIQSYLAAGRPIIGALNGEGARIITESGAGFTCAAEDANGLANLAVRISTMAPAERAVLGRKGRAYFEDHFEREQLLNQLEVWMNELTNQYIRS